MILENNCSKNRETFLPHGTLYPREVTTMWSSVGSAGAVNTADIGKVVFINSVAQLGPGGPIVVNEPASARVAERIKRPTASAVIRYPVQESDLENQKVGVWNLNVRYRDGNGSVVVQLIEVNIATGVEKLMVELQSGVGYPRSNDFHNEISQGTFGTDFNTNVYYMVVTLSAPETIEVETPPAIQLMTI
jgi:hypothetical protein